MEHLPDHELLLEAEGELNTAREHLAACATCRERQVSLLAALDAAAAEQQELELPPIDGARALLHSRLRAESESRWRYAALAAAAAAVILAVLFWPEGDPWPTPKASLTPGAVRTVSRESICAVGADMDRPVITNQVAAEVFRRYGIHDPQPRMYEVDYLIPPDLGGSVDQRNLWPQPYNEGKWNSRVKDALEDRLRTLVCDGTLSLDTAQQEIAADWVGAYRKYFRATDPLPDHIAFIKDRPWE